MTEQFELAHAAQKPLVDDPYAYWRNALTGNFGPVHDGDCQAGFWRRRTKRAGPFVPVATWIEDGKMIAFDDGVIEDAGALWTYICRYPITEEQYWSRVKTGKWHDEDESVVASLAPPPIGHNQGPTDEAEILKGQIEAASAGAADYAEIKDDATAAKAQSLRSRLLELSRDADKKREAEKKPHFEAGKAIDAKFQPLVKAAKTAADAIARALGAHETRKAQEAARAAEAARLARVEAEEAARKLAEAGKPIPTLPPASPEPQAPAAAAPIRGAYGRAASVKVVRVSTVTDQDAVYAFFRTSQEVVDLLTKLAQRATDNGHTVPGTTVEEQRKVS